MIKFLPVLAVASILFTLTACEEPEDLVKETGVVTNLNNGANCSLFITLESGKKIEPLNSVDKGIEIHLLNSSRVSVVYRADNSFVSSCPEATPAQIIEITRLE